MIKKQIAKQTANKSLNKWFVLVTLNKTYENYSENRSHDSLSERNHEQKKCSIKYYALHSVIIYVASETRRLLTFILIVFHSITSCNVSDNICLEYKIKRLYSL